MNRCFYAILSPASLRGVLALACLAGVLGHAPAHAQVSGLQPPPFEGSPNDYRMRPISPKADRGWIEFLSTRDAVVEGRPVLIGGGFRAHDQRSMQITPSRLTGLRLEAFYTLDNMGRLKEVWLMKDDERGRLSPKQKREQALRMQGLDPTHNPRNQRQNLRMVPFDQLPRYQNSLP